jgi:hypothetical protein
VHLQPGTTYEISLQLKGKTMQASLRAQTWSESFPVARRVGCAAQSTKTLVIYSKDPAVTRIIVQRNRIHHPRSNSNNWQQSRPGPGKREPTHPEGPQAVCLWDSEGNHVIRYNTVFSDDDHHYNVTGTVRESPTTISGAFLKTSDRMGGGKILVFHNTILQPPSALDPKRTSGATSSRLAESKCRWNEGVDLITNKKRGAA